MQLPAEHQERFAIHNQLGRASALPRFSKCGNPAFTAVACPTAFPAIKTSARNIPSLLFKLLFNVGFPSSDSVNGIYIAIRQSKLCMASIELASPQSEPAQSNPDMDVPPATGFYCRGSASG